jgi:2-amino-4-hydroxy-6-hydroxymethyldihydropteridine diphosphokinase
VSQHQIYISLGSNIERRQHTRAGLVGLHKIFGTLILSSVYESEAVGFAGSHFYNLVISAYTPLSVEEVCRQLKEIEDLNGRIRGSKKFAPRTLDLDLLLYDDLVECNNYELPRAEILTNAFVLLPLAEIAPQALHPVTGQSYQMLWAEYDKSKQNLWPIDFDWSPDTK